MKLSDYYIMTYANNMDQESQKNERKKVRNLIQKFNKYSDVFGGLAFDYLSVEEQARIAHFFLEECDQRQVIDNLTKTNVDADFSYLKLDDQKSVRSAIADYDQISIDRCVYQVRSFIRFWQDDGKSLLEFLRDSDDQLFQALMADYALHKSIGIRLEWIEYVTGYIDFILNVIFQFFVYRVMKEFNSEDVLNVINKLISKTDCLSQSFDTLLEERYKTIFGQRGLTADRIMQYFRAFIEHRNRLFENSEIYSILINEMKRNPKLFAEVPEEYIAEKRLLTNDEMEGEDFRIRVTENERVPNFKKKLDTVQNFIDVMQKYASRDCYNTCLQDIKVYFREIYLSKQTYRRQKSAKIVEDYLERVKKYQEDKNVVLPDFQRESQYIFIREKINRGYFREKNLSKAYAAKIELTEKVDTLLLKCYWLADSKSALEILHKYNQEMLLCYEEFFLQN